MLREGELVLQTLFLRGQDLIGQQSTAIARQQLQVVMQQRATLHTRDLSHEKAAVSLAEAQRTMRGEQVSLRRQRLNSVTEEANTLEAICAEKAELAVKWQEVDKKEAAQWQMIHEKESALAAATASQNAHIKAEMQALWAQQADLKEQVEFARSHEKQVEDRVSALRVEELHLIARIRDLNEKEETLEQRIVDRLRYVEGKEAAIVSQMQEISKQRDVVVHERELLQHEQEKLAAVGKIQRGDDRLLEYMTIANACTAFCLTF